MLLNCGVGEDSWESLGLQGDSTSPSERRLVLGVIGRTDVEAETLILWLPNAKSWLIRKDPDGGKDWGQEEEGTTEDEMAGWHHWLNGHGFGWTPGVGDGQGGLACCCSWALKESDMTEQMNWTELNHLKWSSSFLSLFMPFLYSIQFRNQHHVVVVYNSFYLDSTCQQFIVEFCIHLHRRHSPVVFLPCNIFIWFWFLSNTGIREWNYLQSKIFLE